MSSTRLSLKHITSYNWRNSFII